MCHYCKNDHATICCADEKCNKKFHLICGIKNNCNLQFCDNYLTYCYEHTRMKPPNLLVKLASVKLETCFICNERMGDNFELSTWIPSCSLCDVGFFHRNCLKTYAISAGYYFHCLSCYNKDYRNEAALMGIYIPESEASWENPEMYSDQNYSLYCSADYCKCDLGKQHNALNGLWQLEKCKFCGSACIHINCKTNNKPGFACNNCIMFMTSLQSNFESSLYVTNISNSLIINDKRDENKVTQSNNVNDMINNNETSSNLINITDNENVEIMSISSTTASEPIVTIKTNARKTNDVEKYVIIDDIEILSESISDGPQRLAEFGKNNFEKNKYKTGRIKRYMAEILNGPAYDPYKDTTPYGCWCKHCAVLDIYDEDEDVGRK